VTHTGKGTRWGIKLLGATAVVTAAVLVAPIGAGHTSARVALATASVSASERGPKVDFRLREIDGSWIDLSQFRGHPVIVDFWATWCPPCRRQIPELKDLYSRYHKAVGLEVVGVSVDSVQGDGVQSARDFAAQLAINYPIVMATPSVLDSFAIRALPTTLFVGRDGRVVSRLMGTGQAGELTAHLKQLLAGAKGGAPTRPVPDDDGVINL
jgi:cytochrome c biogenesis protein CcmG, thiol:disulfide interchange protein DsbE